jgi:hypothetical protein
MEAPELKTWIAYFSISARGRMGEPAIESLAISLLIAINVTRAQ